MTFEEKTELFELATSCAEDLKEIKERFRAINGKRIDSESLFNELGGLIALSTAMSGKQQAQINLLMKEMNREN